VSFSSESGRHVFGPDTILPLASAFFHRTSVHTYFRSDSVGAFRTTCRRGRGTGDEQTKPRYSPRPKTIQPTHIESPRRLYVLTNRRHSRVRPGQRHAVRGRVTTKCSIKRARTLTIDCVPRECSISTATRKIKKHGWGAGEEHVYGTQLIPANTFPYGNNNAGTIRETAAGKRSDGGTNAGALNMSSSQDNTRHVDVFPITNTDSWKPKALSLIQLHDYAHYNATFRRHSVTVTPCVITMHRPFVFVLTIIYVILSVQCYGVDVLLCNHSHSIYFNEVNHNT